MSMEGWVKYTSGVSEVNFVGVEYDAEIYIMLDLSC